MAPTYRLRRFYAAVAGASALSFGLAVTPAFAQSSLNSLVTDVSEATRNVDELERILGGLHQEANRAIVDLNDARSLAEQARRDVAKAEEAFTATQAVLETAQRELDSIASSLYRQGRAPTGDTLDRRTFLRLHAGEKQETVEELKSERTKHANQLSLLKETRDAAEEREEAANQAEVDARNVLEQTTTELDSVSEELEEARASQQSAQEALEEARGVSAPEAEIEIDEVETNTEPAPDLQAGEEPEEEAAEPVEVPGEEAAEEVAQQQPEHSVEANDYQEEDSPIRAAGNPEIEIDTEFVTEALTAIAETSAQTVEETEPVAVEATQETSTVVEEPQPTEVSSDRSAQIETVIARAQSQIGVPYAWGGGNATGPTQGIRDGGRSDSFGDYNKVGFDCSGLVLYAFAGAGINLPHYSGYQYQRGQQIPISEIERGDLLFWGPGGSQHVAIYLGDGRMIEAPHSGSTVRETSVRYNGMSDYAVRLI